MRLCCMCRELKPESDFAFRTIATGARQDHCRACHAAYRRQHYLDNRAIYIAREVGRIGRYRNENREKITAYLREHPCVDCGEADALLLEFDHVDPAEKSSNVTILATHKPWRRVLSEIAKCAVRCVACHRRRTARQFSWGIGVGRPTPRQSRPFAREGTHENAGSASEEARQCSGCLEWKRTSDFSVKNNNTGRLVRRCHSCVAAASREHYRKNREAYLTRARNRRTRTPWISPNPAYRLEYLATHPCVECGETDPLHLDFDHRSAATKIDAVARLIHTRTWSDVKSEIDKCDVRCVRCHRRKTARDFGWKRMSEDPMIYDHAGVL